MTVCCSPVLDFAFVNTGKFALALRTRKKIEQENQLLHSTLVHQLYSHSLSKACKNKL